MQDSAEEYRDTQGERLDAIAVGGGGNQLVSLLYFRGALDASYLLLSDSQPRKIIELSRRLALAETAFSGASIRLREPYSAFCEDCWTR